MLVTLTLLHRIFFQRVGDAGMTKLDYKKRMSDLNKAKVAADDRTLIEILRNYYLEPPSTLPYNLSKPNRENPSAGQAQFVDEFLNKKQNGFYVECGAYDGENWSNSLFFERFRNWTGILIEGNPFMYKELKWKNRKAYTLNACLSLRKYPVMETFLAASIPVLGRVVNPSENRKKKQVYVEVQCFPLYSVLLALNQLQVDYFSLDIEGTERSLLDSIPWDKIDIKLFSLEYNHWLGGKKNLTSYMKDKGYENVKEITDPMSADFIFRKKY